MGSFLVVLEHPPVGGLANVVQDGKQVEVEHLFPVRAIEPLDVGVLIGFPGNLAMVACCERAVSALPKREALPSKG